MEEKNLEPINTLDRRTEIAISSMRVLLAAIPFGLGTIGTEAFFDHRSRIHQKRLNQFTEALLQLAESKSEEAVLQPDLERIIDTVESIGKRVVRTSSIEKHRRFARILLGEINRNEHAELDEHFLDLVSQLDDVHITILKVHAQLPHGVDESFTKYAEMKLRLKDLNTFKRKEEKDASEGLANNAARVRIEINQLVQQVNQMESKRQEALSIYEKSGIATDQQTYTMLCYGMVGRGLLIDVGVVSGEFPAGKVFDITAYGRAFLKFIREPLTNR